METIYQTTSKRGREWEADFTSKERAEADLWKNEYYNGLIVTQNVKDSEFKDLRAEENRAERECIVFGYESDLEKYQYYLKGVTKCNTSKH